MKFTLGFLLAILCCVFVNSNILAEEYPPPISTAAWSPDGTRIVSGGADRFLRVWDASGQPLVDFVGSTGRIRSVDWSPDSTKIVSGGDDPVVRLWDAASGELLATLEGHEDVIQSVDWSSNGTKIASASFRDSGSLRIWDASDYQLRAVRDAGNIYAVQWNHDGSLLAAGKDNGYVSIYDSNLEKTGAALEHSQAITCISWNPDNSKLITGDTDGKIYIWDMDTRTQISTFQAHTDIVDAVIWSPDSQQFATASRDGALKLWDAEKYEVIAALPITKTILIFSIGWSPDGSKIAYGDSDHTIKIVDIAAVSQ